MLHENTALLAENVRFPLLPSCLRRELENKCPLYGDVRFKVSLYC